MGTENGMKNPRHYHVIAFVPRGVRGINFSRLRETSIDELNFIFHA